MHAAGSSSIFSEARHLLLPMPMHPRGLCLERKNHRCQSIRIDNWMTGRVGQQRCLRHSMQAQARPLSSADLSKVNRQCYSRSSMACLLLALLPIQQRQHQGISLAWRHTFPNSSLQVMHMQIRIDQSIHLCRLRERRTLSSTKVCWISSVPPVDQYQSPLVSKTLLPPWITGTTYRHTAARKSHRSHRR